MNKVIAPQPAPKVSCSRRTLWPLGPSISIHWTISGSNYSVLLTCLYSDSVIAGGSARGIAPQSNLLHHGHIECVSIRVWEVGDAVAGSSFNDDVVIVQLNLVGNLSSHPN